MRSPSAEAPARPRHDAPTPAQAARAGVRWLLAQSALGFPGLAHVMRFPRAGGWLPGLREHRGEAFAQAVLGGLLLDIADAVHDDLAAAAALRGAARRLADQVADARSPVLAGGWRYFPTLAALPPDLDSLAAALTLFARAAPQHLLLSRGALALAFALQRPDGAVPTWLIGPGDPPLARAWMHWNVRRHWGSTPDAEVCARFASALHLLDTAEAASTARRIGGWVARQQLPDGRWPSSWYAGDAVAAGLALAAVAPLEAGRNLQARTLAQLRTAQRGDGGWGPFDESAPLDTAVAVALLRQAPDAGLARARGIAFLCDRQSLAGHWKATPWIRMDVGRARGHVQRVATHGCAAISTAACVRTLLQVSAAEAADAAEVTWVRVDRVGAARPAMGPGAGRGRRGCRACAGGRGCAGCGCRRGAGCAGCGERH